MTERVEHDVIVAGLGMVAALGADVITSCAAARAGISRSSPIEHFPARSAVDGAAEAVIGHQASLLTHGFDGEARLIRLAQGALVDLLVQSPDIPWRQRRHHFYLALPDLSRTKGGLDLVADDEARQSRMDDVAWDQEEHPVDPRANQLRSERILQHASSQARWPGQVELKYVSVSGHAGGLYAFEAARSDLVRGATDVAVVLGVDSLIDQDTLEWLQVCGRLKCDGNPVGVQPGEAGAAVALVRADTPRSNGAAAVLQRVSVASEARTLLSGATPAGQALAHVVARSWSETDAAVPWIICDQNGEVYRASDWGHAVVRLRAEHEAFADPIVWYPAVSFGDTGAASSLVGVSLVVRAWQRAYAPTMSAIVVASSDDEPRAALTLSYGGPQ